MFSLFKKKITKNSLFTNSGIEKISYSSTPDIEDDFYIAIPTPNLIYVKNINLRVANSYSSGYIAKKKSLYREYYEFSRSTKGDSDEFWYKATNVYKNLLEKSYKLGLSYGSSVVISEKGIGYISDIKLVCFYDIDTDYYQPSFKYRFSLAYLVIDKDSKGSLYCAFELEPVDRIKEIEVVPQDIEDTFLDLIDSNIVKFVCDKYYKNFTPYYSCRLFANMHDVLVNSQVSNAILKLSNRLKEKNFSVTISKIKTESIEITCKSLV